MGSKLENILRWSKSRASTFYECKRKYYLRYYQHWGGWEADAPEVNRIAYRLGKMQTMATLVGAAVHEVLAGHFKLMRSGQLHELKPDRPLEKMREAWENAKKELWKINPKKFPPLFEIYYQRIPPANKLQAQAEQARCAIRNLKSMPIYQLLLRLGRDDFLWVDPAQEKFTEATYFTIPPYEAIASPDLVYRQSGTLVILDWKTGKPSGDDRLQMGAAALWARQRLRESGPPPLQALLVYLNAGLLDKFDMDEKVIKEAEATIREDMEEMVKYLMNPAKNIPLDIERFPLHNNRKFCWYCEFQEMCFPAGIARAGVADTY